MKRLVWLVLLAVITAGAWFYWSPRAAARDLREAATHGDVEELQRLVDFPLVQEQLKADLKASMMRAMDTAQGGAGALAAGFGGLMVDGMVNQIVSPSGIAALVRYGRADSSYSGRAAPSDLETSMHYEGLSTFVVTARNPQSAPADTVRFYFRRRGMSWQLVRLGMPSLRDM